MLGTPDTAALWSKFLCRKDLNLPKLLEVAFETAAWTPSGGNRRIVRGEVGE